MRSLVALGLVCGMTAPAWARPDGNNDRPPPPGMMRSDVQMRMPVDGRGDTMSQIRDARPEPWQRAERPQVDRAPTTPRMELPIRSDIAQKAHPGDARDMQPKPQGLDARVQNQKPANDRFGRPEAKPALPIRSDVMLKLEREGAEASSNGSLAKPVGQTAKDPAAATGSASKSQAQARDQQLTPHAKEMLCRTAGVCLPQAHATDDSEDKTE